jgi:hypothetical protein
MERYERCSEHAQFRPQGDSIGKHTLIFFFASLQFSICIKRPCTIFINQMGGSIHHIFPIFFKTALIDIVQPKSECFFETIQISVTTEAFPPGTRFNAGGAIGMGDVGLCAISSARP